MSQSFPNHLFEYEIKVMPHHLDQQQHVNNVMYVQLMQEIADKHWESVPLLGIEEGIVWVVRRHEIDYLNEAFLNDRLLLRTWTGENTSVTWNRYCEIVRLSDQKKIIASKSIWVLLDKHTGKPKKIDPQILMRFS